MGDILSPGWVGQSMARQEGALELDLVNSFQSSFGGKVDFGLSLYHGLLCKPLMLIGNFQLLPKVAWWVLNWKFWAFWAPHPLKNQIC